MISLQTPALPEKSAKFRVLIAEDEANIGRLLTMSLQAAGFETTHAADGLAAWTRFQEFDPHLAILDVMMPGLNGRDLCAKIREKSGIPVIMLTALDSEQDQLQGFKMGADDYIPKPFNPRLLIARVISNLRRVYRYDASQEPTPLSAASANAQSANSQSSLSGTPAGWATCEACGYMGPRPKFDHENARGERGMKCPFCGKSEFISFAIA